MKKVTAALAVLLALTLTGCAGAAEDAGDERTAPIASETAAPLAAEAKSPETEGSDAESAFVAMIGESLPSATSIPDASDEQLIEAGWSACEMIRTGTAPGDVRLIEGEQPNGADIYADSSAIMNTALLTLCPELI